MRRLRFCTAVLALLPLTIAAGKSRANETPSDLLSPLARLERERVETTGSERLMDRLGVGPGTVILDVGAGTGQWSFAFARRLQGRGRVYATEIDPLKVAYIGEEARRMGLDTVEPVLVSPDGVDPFYGQHSYHLIFLSHVFYYVKESRDYFVSLGEHLEENGKLVIIVIRHKPLFAPEDVADFEGLAGALKAEGEGSPFTLGIRDSTWAILRQHTAGAPREEFEEAVLEDFNSMLRLPHFYELFDLDGLSFTPEEERQYRWLLGFVEASISYDGMHLPPLEKEENRLTQYGRLIRFLNRLVLFQRFRPYLRAESLRASVLDQVVSRKLAQQGFALEESLDLHPFNYILVFSKR